MGFFSKKPKLTLQDTLDGLIDIIVLTTIALKKQIIEAWTDTTGKKPTDPIDLFICTEILFFLLYMTDRYAFSNGPNFRDNLQDAIAPQSISMLIKCIFVPSPHAKKDDEQKIEAGLKKLESETLKKYNEVGFDYNPCKEFMNKSSAFSEETLMGKFAARIISADEDKFNTQLTMTIIIATVEALAKVQLNQKIGEAYRNHPELH